MSHFSKQSLQCVALLTTEKEIEGRFQTFFANLMKTISKVDIDFVIFTNKPVDLDSYTKQLEPFMNVSVVSHDIPPYDDVYGNFLNRKYGYASGPNILFLKSIRYCEKYSTTLVLETDCILQDSWLNDCINYVKYAGTFLVSGSTYSGHNNVLMTDYVHFHNLNGVAFYNTGDYLFKELINVTELTILNQANKHQISSYDYCIMLTIFNNIKVDYGKWKFIRRNYVTNTLIANVCIPGDPATVEQIVGLYPCTVIIHKK